MDILKNNGEFSKKDREKEIELLFQNPIHYNTIEEYDYVQELVNQEDGAEINSKQENGYIDIEYHNQVGEYKAKMLLQLFNKYREFYQYFFFNSQKLKNAH